MTRPKIITIKLIQFVKKDKPNINKQKPISLISFSLIRGKVGVMDKVYRHGLDMDMEFWYGSVW